MATPIGLQIALPLKRSLSGMASSHANRNPATAENTRDDQWFSGV